LFIIVSSREDSSSIGSMAQLSKTKASDVNSILNPLLKFRMLFSTQVHDRFVIKLEIYCQFSTDVCVVHEWGSVKCHPQVGIIEYILERSNLLPLLENMQYFTI